MMAVVWFRTGDLSGLESDHCATMSSLTDVTSFEIYFWVKFLTIHTSTHEEEHSNIDHDVFVNTLSLSHSLTHTLSRSLTHPPSLHPLFYFCLHSVPVLLAQLYLSFSPPSPLSVPPSPPRPHILLFIRNFVFLIPPFCLCLCSAEAFSVCVCFLLKQIQTNKTNRGPIFQRRKRVTNKKKNSKLKL